MDSTVKGVLRLKVRTKNMPKELAKVFDLLASSSSTPAKFTVAVLEAMPRTEAEIWAPSMSILGHALYTTDVKYGFAVRHVAPVIFGYNVTLGYSIQCAAAQEGVTSAMTKFLSMIGPYLYNENDVLSVAHCTMRTPIIQPCIDKGMGHGFQFFFTEHRIVRDSEGKFVSIHSVGSGDGPSDLEANKAVRYGDIFTSNVWTTKVATV
jgi:hypothetical protein